MGQKGKMGPRASSIRSQFIHVIILERTDENMLLAGLEPDLNHEITCPVCKPLGHAYLVGQE